MKLIIGLGNPGKEYEKTRHNIGFVFLNNYAGMHKIKTWYEKFNGLYSEFNIYNEKVILLKPLSYMNLSGIVVKKYIDYFKISIEDIIVINDDVNLEIGTYRLRAKGSCGGHNGLKNIEQNIGTSNYKRLKIGISNNKNIDMKEYVLGKFSKNELDILDKMTNNINALLDDYITKSFDELMNIYNHK